MIRSLSYIIITIGVLLSPYSNFGSIDSCFSKKNRKANRIHIPKKNDEGKAEHLMVKGMGLFLNGEFDNALKNFELILHDNETSAAAHYMAARCHEALHHNEAFIHHAQAAYESDQENRTYLKLVISALHKNDNLSDITSIYRGLIDNQKARRADYLSLAENYYERANKANEELILIESTSKKFKKKQDEVTSLIGKTIQTYNDMRSTYGPDADVSKTIVHLYSHFGQHELAKNESLENISSFSNDPKLVYQHCQKFYSKFPEETMEYLQEHINKNPSDVSLKLLAHDFFNLEGNKTYAQIMLKEAFDNKTLTLEHRIQIIRSYTKELNPDQLKTAEELANISINYHQDEPLAYFILGDIQSTIQKSLEAIKSYEKGLALAPSKTSYWERVLQLKLSIKDYKGVITSGSEAIQHDSTTASLFWYLGVANQLTKDFQGAKSHLEKGLSLADNPELKFEFNSQLGDIYHELELYEACDRAFDAALLYDPNNDHCLNNYSYFLSLRGEKLEEAEAMCKRLMRLRPNEPNYLDTYAWVLFKLEKYNEAKSLLEQALQSSSDATVWEHYGRTLQKLSLTKEATKALKKAIEFGGNKEELETLINSINE